MVPRSIRPMWFQGLYLRTYFLGFKCWMLTRHIHPMGNLGPKGNVDVSWSCYPGRSSLTNKKGAESSKFLNFFIYTPLFKWDDVCWYFPGLCGVSETTMWHSRQASVNLSLMFPYSRRMMLVLIRPLHSVVSHRNVLGIFIPLPPAVLIGFTHEANIALEAGLAKLCFSVMCSSCFTHGIKAPWFSSTFYKAAVSSRALSSHFFSWF